MPDGGALPAHMRLFARLVDEARSEFRPAPIDVEIPVEFYLSEDQFARECERLFRRAPLIVGHASMIPRPGDHFAHDDAGAPLIVARGRDGKVRVFFNVCRHRGMRLVNCDGVARAPSLVCPYHSWTYDLDGRLKHAPLAESFSADALATRNLVEFPSEVRHGFIWTRLDGAAFDLEAHLSGIGADLDAFGAENSVLFRQTRSVKKTNWKLIVDAFQDGYHVVRLHRHSVGPFFLDGRAVNERAGDNLRAAVARENFAEALAAPPAEWSDRNHATFAYYVFPNSIIVIHPDYISHLGLFPKSVDETNVVHHCLIPERPETPEEREHWERAFDIIENGVFQREDYFVCEGAQQGLASGANKTLLLSGHEKGVAMFHDIVREALARG